MDSQLLRQTTVAGVSCNPEPPRRTQTGDALSSGGAGHDPVKDRLKRDIDSLGLSDIRETDKERKQARITCLLEVIGVDV